MIKINKKYIPVFAVACCSLFAACEDDDTVSAEANTEIAGLLQEINTLDNQLTEYNLEKRTVTLTNRKLKKTLDSLRITYTDFRENGYKTTEVQYSVNVISTANYAQGRSSGLSGATVTVKQGDYEETKETSSGIAVFSGLKEGEAYVSVASPDHTKADMVVHFMADGVYSNNSNYYNASTQVLLYPVSGKNTATIKGNVHANTSTLNDTLNRVFGYSGIFGERANKFVAKPGPFPFYENYTQENIFSNRMMQNPYFQYYNHYYNGPGGQAVQFEKVPAGLELMAVATPAASLQADFQGGEVTNAGFITSITYHDLFFPVQLNEDDSYTVNVPASAGLNMMVQFHSTELVANHTRYTISHDYAGPGTSQESGSERITLRYYNSNDYTTNHQGSVQEDGTIIYPVIDPDQATNLSLYTITEAFRYEIRGPQVLSTHIHPGQVKYQNLYLWPVSR